MLAAPKSGAKNKKCPEAPAFVPGFAPKDSISWDSSLPEMARSLDASEAELGQVLLRIREFVWISMVLYGILGKYHACLANPADSYYFLAFLSRFLVLLSYFSEL